MPTPSPAIVLLLSAFADPFTGHSATIRLTHTCSP